MKATKQANMAQLAVGAKYSCFDDFQAAFAKFCRDTNSIYTVFNSKSIDTENRGRLPGKQYPPELKYRFIKYTCKHYGVNRSKSRGLRPNQSSFKIGCPAYVYLSVQKNELVVERMETNHSHACDPDVLNFYPERRSLAEYKKPISLNATEEEETDLIKSVREDVVDLLRLHIERRRIRNYVRLRTNRILSPADLSNFAKQSQGVKKEISEERSYELLDKLTALESKENAPGRMLEDLVKKEKYKSLKRKVAHVKSEALTPGGSEGGNEDVQEHGYSNPPKKSRSWWNKSNALNKKAIQNIEWDAHTLEEMVKTINPNEEGPVLVHMNNYDGVMVVEIQNGQGGVTQLEGTVVEVEEDLQGDEPRLVAEEPLEDAAELAAGNVTPQKAPHGPAVQKKKIIQFRQRDSKADISQVSPGKSEKDLINLALESAECNPKLEDSESGNQDHDQDQDMMDNESDPGSEHVPEPVYVDCESDYNNDSDVGYSVALREVEKERLQAETDMLRVKTNKLKLQVKYLRNELSKQDLEKEKLRLEIVLLKARIGVGELH